MLSGVTGRRRSSSAFLAVALGTACLSAASGPDTSSNPVYVVDHGWHVGLVVRSQDVSRQTWPALEAFGRFDHVEVGWGDGEYYPAPRGTLWLAVRAAFASTTSVLHVVGFDGPVPVFFAGASIVELRLSPGGFDALARFVQDSYATDDTGQPIRLGPGLYGQSAFYQARGKYRWFNNSNRWTAQALRAAGCPVTPDLAVTAGSVLAQVSPLGRTLGMPSDPAPDRPPDCP